MVVLIIIILQLFQVEDIKESYRGQIYFLIIT